MSGRNQKTLRHFQCRDYLWDVFTQMSQELDTSIDYLINEAMRQYARSRNYGVRPSTGSNIPSPSARPSRIPALGSGAPAPSPVLSSIPPASASPPVVATAPPPFRREPIPPRPSSIPPERQDAPSAVPSRERGPNSTLSYSSAPPPLPGRDSVASSLAPTSDTLSLVFNGQSTRVNKPEFVIGRSSKSSDFAIRDRNISRRHCAVVQENGEYWIRDLGSMNGIEFEGRRVESKRIREGDTFKICDYEIMFTYQ